mmetsp:Transcript_30485/g.59670  ORF Transcript_30485/g.59670 Transcript_30485/m.59670 type:complete len:87 (-) Transcript_30485:1089-1349(-)
MNDIFLGHKIHGVKCRPNFFPVKQLIMSGDYYGNMHFWDILKKKKISKSFKCHSGVLIQIKTIPIINNLITAGWDGFIKYWLNFEI